MNGEPAQTRIDPHGGDAPAVPRPLAWGLILGLGVLIWSWDGVFDRRPEGVPEWGWRLLSIFLPTILALMLRPIAGGAAVLLAVLATVLFGALSVPQALGGYIDS